MSEPLEFPRGDVFQLDYDHFVSRGYVLELVEFRDRFAHRIADLERQRDELLKAAVPLLEIVEQVARSRKGSIGGIGTHYIAQIRVDEVDAALKQARGGGA